MSVRVLSMALLFGVLPFAGCKRDSNDSTTANEPTAANDAAAANDPATASDDDIYRAIARGDGADEAEAVSRAHMVKDRDRLTYLTEVKNLRELIKYSGGTGGTTTIDEYVRRKQTERANAKAVEDFSTKLDAESQQAAAAIRQDYDAKIRAKESESYDKNPQKFNEASAFRGEMQDKLNALEKEENEKKSAYAESLRK